MESTLCVYKSRQSERPSRTDRAVAQPAAEPWEMGSCKAGSDQLRGDESDSSHHRWGTKWTGCRGASEHARCVQPGDRQESQDRR